MLSVLNKVNFVTTWLSNHFLVKKELKELVFSPRTKRNLHVNPESWLCVKNKNNKTILSIYKLYFSWRYITTWLFKLDVFLLFMS